MPVCSPQPPRSPAAHAAPPASCLPHPLRRSLVARGLPLPSALCAVALLLSACGGGGGDGGASAPETARAPVAISGLVVDGPLQGAQVCYDQNDNGACDPGEATATTDADGKYSLAVDAAVAGGHGVVAEVPATAIDKDTGAAVGAAVVLLAPATGTTGAHTVFVSPLTTVVVHVAAETGDTIADAAARVQAQLGLASSPMQDFTASGADSGIGLAARAVGRVMVDTARLAAANGVAAGPAARLVREAASTQLPVLATALEAAAGAPAAEAIAAAAAAVATQLNLTAGTVKAVADAVSPTTVASDAAGPFVSVRRFAYADAGNYSYQLFTGDSSKTDADGAWMASEPRANVVNGESIAFSRNQLYWTGSAWNNCDNGFEVVRTLPQTATRPQRSTYCGGSKSESRTVWEDISGKTLREVITRMRAYPLRDNPGSTTDGSGLPVKWGPDPALLPAEATFPAGSRTNTRRITNDIGNTDRIEIAVRPTVRHTDGVFRQATTLEQLGLMGGDLATAGTVVSNLNALFVEDVPLDSQPDSTLEAFKRWRLAVDVAGLKGRFYRCDVVKATQTSQDCQTVGDATLAVQTQGGVRLLRVASGYPAVLKDRQQRQRFWAEHVGTVFRGTTDLERSYSDQRVNKPAWDALRTALGIAEQVAPAAPVAAGPFTLLRNFSYTDAQNYSWRIYTGDDSVVDAAGETVVSETRRTVRAGAEVPFVRNRNYWSGSAWVDCPDSGPVLRVQVAAPKRSSFCQSFVDEERAYLRISLGGRLMSDVVSEIRSYASTDAGGATWGGWGLPASRVAALSTTRFPAGATLSIRGGMAQPAPEEIATSETDRVRVPTPGAPFEQWPLAVTLEQLIAATPGSLLGASTNGSNALVFRLVDETPTNPLYSRTVDYRVAFDPNGNKARFTRNNRLLSNGFTTNHELMLDTTYTIEQLGDARVVKFAALPADFETRFGYTFRLAERGGQVWYALRSYPSDAKLNWTQRLDGTAWDALRTVLGISQ